jgi:hypothetical protein
MEGEEVANLLYSEQMKNVPHDRRPYVPREYVLLAPQALREQVAGRSVVVVEDVFSSGASAKGFCDTLAEARIQVTTVVGLLGDSRLDCEPQLVSALQHALQHAGISVKGEDVASVLSRGQVNILIDNINRAQGKDEYADIAANLQRVFDSRAARYLGEDTWRTGQKHSHGHDERSQRLRERISGHSRDAGGNGQEASERDETQRDVGENNEQQRDRGSGRGM